MLLSCSTSTLSCLLSLSSPFYGDSTKREARTLNDESKEIREILSSQVRVWQTATLAGSFSARLYQEFLLDQDAILAAKDKRKNARFNKTQFRMASDAKGNRCSPIVDTTLVHSYTHFALRV